MLAGAAQGLADLHHTSGSSKRSKSVANNERNKRLFMLLGGRSGRVRMAKDSDTGEYIQVIDDGNSSPLLEIV